MAGARQSRKGARILAAVSLAAAGVLLLALVASGATNPFGEVPKGHWSYAALAEFAYLGLIDGYSENAFAGERVITRYEMAWAIARLELRVRALEGASQSQDSSPSADQAVSSEGGPAARHAPLSLLHRELLARLQEEFAGELAIVAEAKQYVPVGTANGDDAVAPIHGLSGMSLGSSVIAGGPLSEVSSGISPALKLTPDPGAAAATSALKGDVGQSGPPGGKRLSELVGKAPPASDAYPGGSQKTLSIPLDAGAQAELSLGGPPMPGGISSGDGDDVIARLDLKYAMSQLAIFRASYELARSGEDPAGETDASAAKATALLGVDYNFVLSDSAFVRAGYTYSKTTDLVPKGVEVSTPPGGERAAEGGSKAAGVFGDYTLPGLSLDARKTIASLGLGYTFGGTTSVVLGYKLIDFHELDPESLLPGLHRTNVATAELTIRF